MFYFQERNKKTLLVLEKPVRSETVVREFGVEKIVEGTDYFGKSGGTLFRAPFCGRPDTKSALCLLQSKLSLIAN